MDIKNSRFKIGEKVIAIVDIPRQNIKTSDSLIVERFFNDYLFYAKGKESTYHVDCFMTKETLFKLLSDCDDKTSLDAEPSYIKKQNSPDYLDGALATIEKKIVNSEILNNIKKISKTNEKILESLNGIMLIQEELLTVAKTQLNNYLIDMMKKENKDV